MSWHLRPARREDSTGIWNLIKELADFERLTDLLDGSAAEFERWVFEEKVARVLVAEENETIVGYALYFPILSTFKMRPALWLEDLYVQKARRGVGIGKALIGEVIDYAKKNGYARLDWTVLNWNVSAIEFYRSLGAELLTDWRVCRVSF
jgi:GNAT superfamily N-acetyltransferase